MKSTSFITALFLSLSLVFVSCKENKKDQSEGTQSEMSINKDTINETGESVSLAITKNVITENEDQYPHDIDLFDNKEITSRLKKITGDVYDSIMENFNTETPIVSLNGVYKFTGCKEHDCPAFHTTVIYDAKDDNFNVLVAQKGSVKVYDEKGKITMTKALKLK